MSKKAKIVLGVIYDNDTQLEQLIQAITMDTEGYSTHRHTKPRMEVYVDDVLMLTRRKK